MREYYRALRGIKENAGVVEDIQLAQNVVQVIDKTNEQNKVVSEVKQAQENALKVSKAVEEVNQKNIVLDMIRHAQKNAQIVSDVVVKQEGIVYNKDKYVPGYLVAKEGRKFNIGQFSKDVSKIVKDLVPGDLPDFIDGESLYKQRDVVFDIWGDMTYSDFANEIYKKAHKTIAKALKNEYDIKVQQTSQAISMSNEYDDYAMGSLNKQQDICGNILHHFVSKKKAKQVVMEKGVEYNPRFVAQLGASDSLGYTAEQITTRVLDFYNNNREKLKDYNANTIFALYEKSVGAKNLEKAIRSEVVNPMINAIHQESRQLA